MPQSLLCMLCLYTHGWLFFVIYIRSNLQQHCRVIGSIVVGCGVCMDIINLLIVHNMIHFAIVMYVYYVMIQYNTFTNSRLYSKWNIYCDGNTYKKYQLSFIMQCTRRVNFCKHLSLWQERQEILFEINNNNITAGVKSNLILKRKWKLHSLLNIYHKT